MCIVIFKNALFQVATGEVLDVDAPSAFVKAIYLFDPFQVN